MSSDTELLVGLSIEELEALAGSLLATAAQARQKEKLLSPEEGQEVDDLLRKIDQLTILKTRARYTLNRERAAATQT